jgi:hypothetical protein
MNIVWEDVDDVVVLWTCGDDSGSFSFTLSDVSVGIVVAAPKAFTVGDSTATPSVFVSPSLFLSADNSKSSVFHRLWWEV